MGFLKKIFKPVSKVLDKVIPNEVKPFLPYAAAFAPMIAPGIMGAFGNTMLSRAAMGGGLNIFGQLAQEGNEGDINLLSAGLGALTGAMTKPTGVDFSMSGPGEGPMITKGSADIFRSKAAGIGTDTLRGKGLEALAKGSDIFAAGMKDPFSMAGLKAASIPAAQATGDLLFAQAKRDQDAYDDMMSEDSSGGYTDDAYRAAIRKSMEAYGASEEEILRAIEAAGYKTGGRVGFSSGDYVGSSDNETMEDEYDSYIKEIEIDGDSPMSFSKFKKMISEDYAKGGRVGLRFGGIGAAINQIDNQEMKEAAKFASMLNDMDVPIADLAEEFEIQFKRKPNSLEELKQFYKDRYDYKGPGDVKMKEEIKEKVVMEAKDGGRIGLQEGGVLQQLIGQAEQLPAFAPTLQQAGAVFPRLNQLEQGVDRAEETLGRIRSRLGPEQKTQLAGFQPMLQPALGYQPLNMLNLNRGMGISALQSGPEAQGMKDGGLMDLDGKEMDLRKGGFVPIGKKERADDVPTRLSKNEFVMTADAVRAAGGGSVNKGAKRMYDVMNKLEARA